MKSSKAFTLVELLVVITIISILAGMLLAVLQKARWSACLIGCVSNCKEFGVALHSYSNDYDGCQPVRLTGTSGYHRGVNGTIREWLFEDYLGVGSYRGNQAHGGVWICPSHSLSIPRGQVPGNVKYQGKYADTGLQALLEYNSYWGNWMHYHEGAIDPDNPEFNFKVSHFSRASRTPFQFCGERYWWSNKPSVYGGKSWHNQVARPTIFYDAHARALKSLLYTTDTAEICLGPYSTYNFRTGGGSPAHRPWDYWINEY